MPHFEHSPFGPVAGPELALSLFDKTDTAILSNYNGQETERVQGLGEAVISSIAIKALPDEVAAQFPPIETTPLKANHGMMVDISRAVRDHDMTIGLMTKIRLTRHNKGVFGAAAARDYIEYWINAGNGGADSFRISKYSSFAACNAPSQKSVPRQRTAEDAIVSNFLESLPEIIPGFSVDETLESDELESWPEPRTPEVAALISLMASIERQ